MDSRKDLKAISIMLAVMCIVSGVWYFMVQNKAGHILLSFAENAVGLNSIFQGEKNETVVVVDLDGGRNIINSSPIQNIEKESLAILTTAPQSDSHWTNFFRLDQREPIVQLAFGKALPYMNTWQKVGFSVYWWFVLWLVIGIMYGMIKGKLGAVYKSMCIAGCIIVVVSIVVPYMSMCFGVIRAFEIAFIILAPCFIIGLYKLAERLKSNVAWLLVVSIAPYIIYAVVY
jgi:hypothetical protein